MRYDEFREAVRNGLRESSDGMTWKELREELELPYSRPCQSWIHRLEEDIGLVRRRRRGRALIWELRGV